MKISHILKLLLWYSIVSLSIFFSFISSNKDNPVRLSSANAQDIHAVFPQGWAFFTRSPREEVLRVYESNKNEEEFEHLNRSSSLLFADLLGVKRDKRKLSSELAEIIKKVPTKSWIEYEKEDLLASMQALEVTDTIQNPFTDHLLKGDKIIYRADRIPWAWSKSDFKMPYRLVKIHIK